MKKLTIRVDNSIYDRLFIVSKEKKLSVNKIISSILQKYINNPRETDYLKDIDSKLKMLSDNIERISKRQSKHFKLSQQQFANFGYLLNADIKEDKCLNEILNNKDNFNE